jgi:SagB-type dehydrogenase family enzyme
MSRRRVRYILNGLLLVAAVVVILTGFVVDRLDLNQFTPHRWAGYAVAVLIAIHVGLHWRWFLPSRWVGGQRVRATDASGTGAPPARPAPAAAGAGPTSAGELTHGSAPGAATNPAGDMPDPAPDAGHQQPRRPSRRTALAAIGAGAAGVVVGWSAKSEVSPVPYEGGDVGLFYHRESSLGLRGLISDLVDWGRRPAQYLRVGEGQPIALPTVVAPPVMTVAQALEQRRSLREYADRAVTDEELAWVVRAATGITSSQGRRAAPSAGALYPIETYVAVRRVDGIDPGVYHVDVRAQALEPVRDGSAAGDLMVAGLGQDFLRRAPVVLVLTGRFQRSRWKYRERHYRYVSWEGGHITQNVYLAAETLGLGACMVGAFFDGMVNDIIGVDGREEAALGLIALGPR